MSDPGFKKILIIDDDGDYRNLLKNYIGKSLPHVDLVEYDPVAGGIPDEKFDWSQFDVLILDYYLCIHNFTGMDLLQKYHKLPAFPATIMLTGAGNEEIAVRALKFGIHDYLNKASLTRDRLKLAILEAWEARKKARQKRNEITQHNLATSKEIFYQKLERPAGPDGKGPERMLIVIGLDESDATEKYNGIFSRDHLLRHIALRSFEVFRAGKCNPNITRLGDTAIALQADSPESDKTLDFNLQGLCTHLSRHPYQFKEIKYKYTVSIGVVKLNKNNISATELINMAVTACRLAGKTEGNSFHVWSDQDILPDEESEELPVIEVEMEQAMPEETYIEAIAGIPVSEVSANRNDEWRSDADPDLVQTPLTDELISESELEEEFQARAGVEGRISEEVISESELEKEFQAREEVEGKISEEVISESELEKEFQARAIAKARAESEVKAEVEAKAEAEVQARIEAEVQARIKAEARAEAEARARAEADAKAEAAARALAEAMAATEAKTKAETEAKAIAAKVEAEIGTELKQAAEAKAEAETELKIAAEAKAVAETELKIAALAKAEADIELKHAAEAKAEAETELKIAAEAKARADAEARAMARAREQLDAEARAVAEAKQKLEAGARAAGAAKGKPGVDMVPKQPPEKPVTNAPDENELKIKKAISEQRGVQTFQPVIAMFTDKEDQKELFKVSFQLIDTDGSVITMDKLNEQIKSISLKKHIDQWMFSKILGRIVRDDHNRKGGYMFLVPISEAWFSDIALYNWLQKILDDAGDSTPGTSVTIEIKAAILKQYKKRAVALVNTLQKNHGFSIALGGITSIGDIDTLSRFTNFSLVIINHKQVRELHNAVTQKVNQEGDKITLIQSLREKGIRIIADGIEDSTSLTDVISAGTDFAMGKFIGETQESLGDSTNVESFELS